MPGALYIVATPIGNLEDITLRALRILREADLIAAEDTRHTRKLLAHFQIDTPLVSYHQHSPLSRIENLIHQILVDGRTIALVTDAGTPGISDPGEQLTAAAIAAGVNVIALPGASAVLCALAASGLPTSRFTFEGFLPRANAQRREKLARLGATETRTMIFYEAGNRTAPTLKEMSTAFGSDRAAAVGRELTKLHEEVLRGSLGDITSRFAAGDQRGEVTIVVCGKPEGESSAGEIMEPVSPQTVEEALAAALSSGMTSRDAVKQVSDRMKRPRREVYAAMLNGRRSEDV